MRAGSGDLLAGGFQNQSSGGITGHYDAEGGKVAIVVLVI